jgi:hypothetical protein
VGTSEGPRILVFAPRSCSNPPISRPRVPCRARTVPLKRKDRGAVSPGAACRYPKSALHSHVPFSDTQTATDTLPVRQGTNPVTRRRRV